MHDIIIVGGGPAGLTAALYALRANKSVLIIEKGAFGGQITFSPRVENYPAFESISGNELADKMVSQVLGQGAEVECDTVTEIKDGKIKTVITEDGGNYECKSVIIAAGAKHRHLGLENEERFIGDGISFCAVCDGAFYKDKTVTVVGGGNSALQEILLLAETCKKVFVIQNLAFLTGEKKLVELVNACDNVEVVTEATVSEILGTDSFTGIIIKTPSGEREILSDGLFVAIGLEPENGIFEGVAALDSFGYINAGEDCTTKTAGVFVAGDCRTKRVRQVATAVSDGASAAIAACRYCDGM